MSRIVKWVVCVSLCAASIPLSVVPAASSTGSAGGTIVYEAIPVSYSVIDAGVTGTYCCDGDVYAMAPDGSNSRMLFKDGVAPKISPDRRQIAFTGADGDLYVSSSDGSDRRKVVDTENFFEFWPTWSPDGTRLAYARWDLEGKSALYIVDLESGTVRRLTNSPQGSEDRPSWSPDGRWIAFVRYDTLEPEEASHVHLVSPDGSRLRRITHGTINAMGVAWSPDSRWLVYSSDAWTNAGFASRWESDLYLVPRRGHKSTQITNGPMFDHTPCWSPDGNRIAFSRSPSQALVYPVVFWAWTGVQSDIYSIKPDGSDLRQITATPAASEESCDWIEESL